MLRLSWQTLRFRWIVFIGTFIALSLGVCLMTTTLLSLAATISGTTRAPLWYANADIVVTGSNAVPLATAPPPPEVMAVPASVADRLTRVEGAARVVLDRRVPVDVEDTATTAHPWASAMLHPYTFVVGGPPTAANQVVLTAPSARRPGDLITAQTPDGPLQWTVVGIVTAREPAVYLTDELAARLAAGRIDAVALRAAAGVPIQALAARVRRVVALEGLRVLTGQARGDAVPDPDALLLFAATLLLGTTAGIAGFAAVFVMIGTSSFAVAQRQREFALLRITGATPVQVHRLVLGEAVIVGIGAAVAGCALGIGATPLLARWLASAGLAPGNFTTPLLFWPIAAAGGTGPVIALLGSWAAAFQASRVRPIEALRAASSDRRTMTPRRWVFGILFLAGTVGVVPVALELESQVALSMALAVALLAMTAAALLAPALIPIIISAVGWPLRGGVGILARSNALSGLRRTSSTAVPILITVSLAWCELIGTATLWEAQQQAWRERITATAMVVSNGVSGLADPTIAALDTIPGVRAAVPTRQSMVYIDNGQSPYDFPAIYVGEDIGAALHLPALAGSITDLHGTDTVAVSHRLAEAHHWRLGSIAKLWLSDSAQVQLRVVAILPDSVDLGNTVLLPWKLRSAHGLRTGADTIYLALNPGVSASAVVAAAQQIASSANGRVIPIAAYLAARSDEENRVTWVALFAQTGLALLYTGIAIANTFIMATADRVRDLAVLRLSGATPRQVLSMIAVEAFLVTLAGGVLAAVISTGMLAVVRANLSGVMAQPPVAVPWTIGLVAACSLIIALAASLVSARQILRIPAARLISVRE